MWTILGIAFIFWVAVLGPTWVALRRPDPELRLAIVLWLAGLLTLVMLSRLTGIDFGATEYESVY